MIVECLYHIIVTAKAPHAYSGNTATLDSEFTGLLLLQMKDGLLEQASLHCAGSTASATGVLRMKLLIQKFHRQTRWSYLGATEIS